MRHEAPRQRTSDGRWDFTSARGDDVHAMGYCRAAMTEGDWADLALRVGYEAPASERAQHAEFAHKFHTDGHATAEEASACYREYLLDFQRRSWQDRETRRKCQICEAWTDGVVMVGQSEFFHLCEQHQDRESVASLCGPVGERYVS